MLNFQIVFHKKVKEEIIIVTNKIQKLFPNISKENVNKILIEETMKAEIDSTISLNSFQESIRNRILKEAS